MEALERADAMLVVGSSLMVYSGFRFAQAAARLGIPIAAVNLGRTRADDLLTLKVQDRCEAALGFLGRIPQTATIVLEPGAGQCRNTMWRSAGIKSEHQTHKTPSHPVCRGSHKVRYA